MDPGFRRDDDEPSTESQAVNDAYPLLRSMALANSMS